MTCHTGYGGCGYQFCWECQGSWEGHSSSYTCNRYFGSKGQKRDNDIGKKKVKLNEFNLYSNKFNTQLLLSKDTSNKNILDIIEKLSSLFDIPKQQLSFLYHVNLEMNKNYKVIANSYIYEYFKLEKN